VNTGRITRKRIDQSVARVLAAKSSLGLARQRIVNIDNISEVIDDPATTERAQQVADRAVTLVRNQGDRIPVRNPDKACLFVVLESRYTQQGRQLIQDVRKRSQQMTIRVLDPMSPEAELKDSIDVAPGCDAVVVAAYVTASAYRGNVSRPGPLAGFVTTLTEASPQVVLVSFGNPYLLRPFPKTAGYMATFSTVPMSETSVAKAIFGEIRITGRLPVSIPGFANIGDGIQLDPARSSNHSAARTQ
jgi:beta-N-acetylhexosaminidase